MFRNWCRDCGCVSPWQRRDCGCEHRCHTNSLNNYGGGIHLAAHRGPCEPGLILHVLQQCLWKYPDSSRPNCLPQPGDAHVLLSGVRGGDLPLCSNSPERRLTSSSNHIMRLAMSSIWFSSCNRTRSRAPGSAAPAPSPPVEAWGHSAPDSSAPAPSSST